MNHRPTYYLTSFGNLLFLIVLVVFWRFSYVNHLLQKEQLQLFLTSSDYLWQKLCYPGGLSIYLAEFISQFFLFPWVAACSVSLLALLFAFLTQRILSKISKPDFFPLAFLPAMAYSILLLNSLYQISGLVATVLACASVLLYLSLKNQQVRFIAGLILLPLTQWATGAAVILFAATIIIAEIKIPAGTKAKSKFRLLGLIGSYLAMTALFPLFCKLFFLTDNLQESYLSRAFYHISLLFPAPLVAILLAVPMIVSYYAFVHEKLSDNIRSVLNVAFSVIAIAFLFWGLKYQPNRAEENEMHYDNLVAKAQWSDILGLAKTTPPTGQQGKLALSLALAQIGQMSEKLFYFSPNPNDFFIPFDLKGMAPLIANEPYYYLGLINFSKALAFESIESTADEKMPVRAVKRFVETCIISGQYQVAKHYLWYLEQTVFYRNWAKQARQYLFNDEKVNAHPLWGKLRRQQPKDEFYFQYEKNDLALVTLLRTDTRNKLAYEYLMGWYLLRKDFNHFLKYLPLMKAVGYTEIPESFQQALAYIKTLVKDDGSGLDSFPISLPVQQALMSYAQAFKQGGSQNPNLMKKQFGNTYWYYLHFTKVENE